jgi:hypothetical protein
MSKLLGRERMNIDKNCIRHPTKYLRIEQREDLIDHSKKQGETEEFSMRTNIAPYKHTIHHLKKIKKKYNITLLISIGTMDTKE